MSAFVCSDELINLLVQANFHLNRYRNPDEDDRQIAANLLRAENIRSVNFRYREKSIEPTEVKLTEKSEFLRSDVVRLASLLDCYEYQTCETDDWETTWAYRWCHRFRALLCTHLPGYDSVSWAV